MALREGPLPASGRLRGPSLRVCCLGISAAPRRRDGLAGRDRASFVAGCYGCPGAGWNISGPKNDVAPRHLDLAPLGNRVPRRWVWFSHISPISYSVSPSQVAPRASGMENRQVVSESMLWGHINGPTLSQRIGIGWDKVNNSSRQGVSDEVCASPCQRSTDTDQGVMCRRRGPEPERPEGVSEDTRRQTCRPFVYIQLTRGPDTPG